MDDGADKRREICRVAYFQRRGLGDQLFLEGGPDGLGYVAAGAGAAFLAGVLESGADGVDDGVGDGGGGVDQVEVLAAGFADDAWVARVVVAFADPLADFGVE